MFQKSIQFKLLFEKSFTTIFTKGKGKSFVTEMKFEGIEIGVVSVQGKVTISKLELRKLKFDFYNFSAHKVTVISCILLIVEQKMNSIN